MKNKFILLSLAILIAGKTFCQVQYNAETYHQFNTNYGTMQIGAGNYYWAHIYTDRGKLYINKPIELGI